MEDCGPGSCDSGQRGLGSQGQNDLSDIEGGFSDLVDVADRAGQFAGPECLHEIRSWPAGRTRMARHARLGRGPGTASAGGRCGCSNRIHLHPQAALSVVPRASKAQSGPGLGSRRTPTQRVASWQAVRRIAPGAGLGPTGEGAVARRDVCGRTDAHNQNGAHNQRVAVSSAGAEDLIHADVMSAPLAR